MWREFGLGWFGLGVALRFTQMFVIEGINECLVCGFGEHTLFLKNGQDSLGLLNKFNTGSQIHTEINEHPVNGLFLVLFLFQYEHVMIEELLQSLISVVNTQLFKRVVIKDFKSSNVEYTNEELTLVLGVQCFVDTQYNLIEHTVEERFRQGLDTECHLSQVLSLGHHLVTDLYFWSQDGVEEIFR